MEAKEQKLLEFLLADFNAIKSEIARRSNLQKAAVAALFALYAWVFNKTSVNIEAVILSWVAAILAGMYVYRESREISRLGWVIKHNVAGQASKIIGVDEKSIFPSEAHASEPSADIPYKIISTIFAIVIYFIVPLYLTIKYFCPANGT
jgi:hypothetical protein